MSVPPLALAALEAADDLQVSRRAQRDNPTKANAEMVVEASERLDAALLTYLVSDERK